MIPIIKIKPLCLAVLLATPPVAAWSLRERAEKAASPANVPAPKERVVVEVLGADGRKEWMMVEVPHEAVPEPASAVLMMLSSLLLLRRQRDK